MEAPKKIYVCIPDNHIIGTASTRKGFPHQFVTEEYISTDTLIHKAAIWFSNNFMVHDEYGVISDSFNTKEEMFENFKNYMKGE